MNKAAVYHRTENNLCYALNESELMISIRTGTDINKVVLCWNDPYDFAAVNGTSVWFTQNIIIKNCKILKYNKIWSAKVSPKYRRCKYYFILYDNDEKYYYFENGVVDSSEKLPDMNQLHFFCMPWMNKSDINIVPEWVSKITWYQIVVDKFKSVRSNRDVVEDNYYEITHHLNDKRVGGDFIGVAEKMKYLSELGIRGIYLSPVCKSYSNHNYDVIDFETIDELLGGKDALKALVKTAHNYKIRVMFDAVFNHVSIYNCKWQDVMQKGQKSKYYDWFIINDWPLAEFGSNAQKGIYYTYALRDDMPKLNTNNREVIEYFINIVKHWIKYFEIDALRLDVGNEISHHFVRELRTTVKTLKPDFFLLGETWNDSIDWLMGDQYDSIMNYKLKNCIDEFWSNKCHNKFFLEQEINYCYSLYMKQTNTVLFNLLDSHDTDRLLYRNKGNIDAFFQQLVLLFLLPGSACIFYGTEVGLTGDLHSCRQAMKWEFDSDSKRIFDFVRGIINFRNKYDYSCKEFIFLQEEKENSKERILKIAFLSGDYIFYLIENCSENDICIKETFIEKENVILSNLYKDNIVQTDGLVVAKIQKNNM